MPRLVARFGGGERDHLNGGGVNIQAINVNDGEYDASGPLIYRPPTDRAAWQGQPEIRRENVTLLKWFRAVDAIGEGTL